MRREFRRQSSSEKDISASRNAWRLSLGASLRAAERRPLSKDDLKKTLAEAARNTANMQKAHQ